MYNTPKDEDGGIEYLMKPQPVADSDMTCWDDEHLREQFNFKRSPIGYSGSNPPRSIGEKISWTRCAKLNGWPDGKQEGDDDGKEVDLT